MHVCTRCNVSTSFNSHSTGIYCFHSWLCLCKWQTSHVWLWATYILRPDHLIMYSSYNSSTFKYYNSAVMSIHLMHDGSPNDILKESLNIMLAGVSILWWEYGECHVGVYCGTSYRKGIYSYIVHLTYILVTYMLLNFQTQCLYTLPCSCYKCSVQWQYSGAPHNQYTKCLW